MTGTRCLLSIATAALLAGEASAQFFPYPLVAPPVVLVPNGVGFTYNSKKLNAFGFFGTGPVLVAPAPYYYPGPVPYGGGFVPGYGPAFPPVIFGSNNVNYNLQIINPPVAAPRRFGPPPPDTSGIDLDVESSAKIWGKKSIPVKVAALPEPVPKKDLPKGEKLVAPLPVPVPVKPMLPDGQRQIDNGLAAFRNGDFGIAAIRFRQGAEVAPVNPRAQFYQAQAYIAAGKYHEAVQLIQLGLKRQPDWPGSDFNPRKEMYVKQAERWNQHLARLEQVQRLEPKDADYLFLLGYLTWFDGQRKAAVDYFQQARAVAADPQWADLFLKAAK